MKVQLIHGIAGSFHRDTGSGKGFENLPDGAIVDIDTELGERLVASGGAKPSDANVTHRPH